MALDTIDILGGVNKSPSSLEVGTTDVILAQIASTVIGANNTSTTSASTQTALDITSGRGSVEYVGIQAPVAVTSSLLKITIDGVVVYNNTAATSGVNQGRHAIGSVFGNTTDGYSASFGNIAFNKSIKIEFASDGSGTVNCSYRYYLT